MKFFFDHFEVLADAPDGIKKLREMILQLAVMGKLVPQDPKDEPAGVLLEKIKKKKELLIKEGKLKKQKPLPPITEEQKPFELPKGWAWVRLGNLGFTQTGTTPPKTNPEYFGEYIPFIKPADIFESHINYDNEGLSKKGVEKGRLIKKNSILMVCIGGSIGKVNYIEKDCSCNQQINTITPYMDISYELLTFFMGSKYFQTEVLSRAPQTTLPILSKGKWELIPLSLPPLIDQKRIVAKVDQLMSFCDELEKKKEKRENKRISLNNACLDKLLTSREPGEFQEHWQRIVDHFDILYNHPGNVAKLKQAILQLAVMGKLVPQDPSDEPAGVLLEKIKEEKERLIKEGKIKKQKLLPLITEEEKPFELPKGWGWCRLNELGEFCGGGTPSMKIIDYWNGNIHWVSPKDMKKEFINESEMRITQKALDETNLRLIPTGSILIVARSGILKRMLPISINNIQCTVNQDLKVIIPHISCISQYLKLMLKGFESFILRYLVKEGMTVQSLKYSEFEIQHFPLPPLNEQKRIVSKVDRFLVLCDRLADSLQEADSKKEKLFQAVVNQVQEFKNRT